MLAKVCSATVNRIEAFPVEVEVDSGWRWSIPAGFCLMLCVTLLVSGCKPALKTTDISGRYEPTPSTVQMLNKMGYATNRTPALEFGTDKSLSMTNMPDVWLNMNRGVDFGKGIKNPCYQFGSGHWSLSHEQGDFNWYIDCDFDTFGYITNGAITKLERYVVGNLVEFNNRKKPFEIQLVVGDPDSGDFLVFRRVK